MPISYNTAVEIAHAWREIEVARELLAQVENELSKREDGDVRDAFGRRVRGLQLGVPCGNNGHQLLDVSWQMAKPVIIAHIAQKEAAIAALSEAARAEL